MQLSDADDALTLLYVVPGAIVGLELELEPGLLAAAVALGLLGLWVGLQQPSLDAVGILTRALAIFSIGALAGRYSDRMRAQARMNIEFELARTQVSEQFVAPIVFWTGMRRKREDSHNSCRSRTRRRLRRP